MVSFEMNDEKKIGLGLTAFGIFFSFLGIIFFFDKGLLAMGNILFISGVTLTIGLKSTMQFFMKRQNFTGTISFGVGFFLIVIGWPIFGMIWESLSSSVVFGRHGQCLCRGYLFLVGFSSNHTSHRLHAFPRRPSVGRTRAPFMQLTNTLQGSIFSFLSTGISFPEIVS
ncbi:hypothetical protein PTKIN_Ptkin11bG0145200 [Pterospermum kingtungense]